MNFSKKVLFRPFIILFGICAVTIGLHAQEGQWTAAERTQFTSDLTKVIKASEDDFFSDIKDSIIDIDFDAGGVATFASRQKIALFNSTIIKDTTAFCTFRAVKDDAPEDQAKGNAYLDGLKDILEKLTAHKVTDSKTDGTPALGKNEIRVLSVICANNISRITVTFAEDAFAPFVILTVAKKENKFLRSGTH